MLNLLKIFDVSFDLESCLCLLINRVETKRHSDQGLDVIRSRACVFHSNANSQRVSLDFCISNFPLMLDIHPTRTFWRFVVLDILRDDTTISLDKYLPCSAEQESPFQEHATRSTTFLERNRSQCRLRNHSKHRRPSLQGHTMCEGENRGLRSRIWHSWLSRRRRAH